MKAEIQTKSNPNSNKNDETNLNFHMSFSNKNNLITWIKESLWVISGQLLALIGSFALVRVMTSLLSPTQYGELALGLTALGLISQILINSIGASIARFYPVAFLKNQLKIYWDISKKLLFKSGMLSMLIGIGLSTILFLNKNSHWAILSLLGFIFATLSFYNFTINSIQNAARNRSTVALHTSIESWLKILTASLAIYFLGSQASSALIGYCAALVLLLLSQKHFLSKKFSNLINHSDNSATYINNWQKDILSYAWPFASWGIFTWAQQTSDLWSLNFFTNTAEVGLYTVIFQLGYAPIILLNSIIQQLIGPILNQHVGLNNETIKKTNVHFAIWATTFLSLIFTFIIFLFVLIYHDWLFHWLVAEDFRPSSNYFAWMILAGGLFSAGQTLSLKLMSQFKSREMISIKIFTSLLGLTLNIMGAWVYGFKGVVGSLFIFSFVYFIWMAWLTWQKQH